MCRLQIKASHTFESRKFNVFIDLFVAEIDLGTRGDDQRELHSFPAGPPRLKQDTLYPGENQFAYRASVRSRLRFQPAVERRGDIDGGANAILLHKGYYPMCAINMDRVFSRSWSRKVRINKRDFLWKFKKLVF